MQLKMLAKARSKSKVSLKNHSRIRTETNLSIPGVVSRGWFRQILITPSKESQDFEINPEFAHHNEVIPGDEKAKSDDTGSLDIPDEKSFYMVLTSNTINILSSRRNMITKTVDVIDLNVVDKIKIAPDQDGNMVYSGGLLSMGVFDEGKCFQLTLNVGFKYIVCSSDQKLERQWEEAIQRFQDAKMLELGNPFKDELTVDRNFTLDMDKFDLPKYIKEQTKEPNQDEVADLGDWSICDHVCGGGNQVKQRGCKPPVSGHQCKKKPVQLSRACNTQPCDKGVSEKESKVPVMDESWRYMQPTITLPPKLDARFVSHRYQEQEECKIKDEDLCIRRQDLVQKLQMHQAPILPGRAVLNRKTFTFYENSKYDSLQRSFALEDLEVKLFAHDSNCFEAKSRNETTDSLVLCGCPFAANAGITATTWIDAIDMFKFKCGGYIDGSIALTEKDKIEMTIGNEEVEISPEMMRSIEKEAIEAKKNDEAAKAEDLEARKVDDALNKVESIAADATQNEFFKEQLLQKEKQEKARKDVDKLDSQIQKAEEKLKCMQAEIKKAQDKAEKERLRSQTREEVAEVAEEVQHEVQAVKKTFHNKIDNFAVETDRLKAKKLKQLTELRLQMTKIMIDQQSKGKRSNCLVEKEDQKNNQCNAKFTANWYENNVCRKKENFCGVCCDREFSVSQPEDREKCIYECQLKNGQLKSSNDRVSESNQTATVETIT